jgi:uncharacterized protein YggE
MKKLIFILTILFVLLSFNASASEMPDFPFVFAEGKAETEVPPDMAIVRFYVKEFNEDPTKALAVVRERSSELLTFFAKLKIAEKDITAYEIDKRPMRERDKNYTTVKILGYEIWRYISVTLRDLTQYEQFIKKLLSLNNIMNIRTKFERSDREKIEVDLIAQACQNAHEQAKLMAKGLGVQLGSVFSISQEGFANLSTKFGVSGYERYIHAAGSTQGIEGEEFLFVPSTITFRNSVRVIFKLKQEE